MSGFKDMVSADNASVFLNVDEFGDIRTIKYDGNIYKDIKIILTGIKEKDRRQLTGDHAQGFFYATAVMHCMASDMNYRLPENRMPFQINDEEGGGGFFRSYRVISASEAMGMFRIELGAIEE